MESNLHARRWEALKNERSSWMDHWQELSDNLLPRSGRFFVQDRNRGEVRHNRILDNTGTRAVRTLGAGMLSGMSSPARPWFKLATPDDKLNKYGPVKVWLDETTKLLYRILYKARAYKMLHAGYEEIGAFGSWAAVHVKSFDTVTHFHGLTIGEYALATNWEGNVDTMFREFDATVAQLVGQFGLDRVTEKVRSAWNSGNLDQWHTVIHAIEPNTGRDASKADNRNMPFTSCYFEKGARQGQYLRESGFKTFRALAGRWDAKGGDVYGSCPGMDALGDVKQLQHQQLRKAQAIDYQANPPVLVPVSLKASGADLLPGGVSYYDGAGQGIQSAFDVPLNLQHLLLDIQDVRGRIKAAFYEDLFLMLANDSRSGTTAYEIAQRHEEKLVMLGPVVERVSGEIHVPMIDSMFEDALAAGLVAPAPDELHDMDLNVEFTSLMAQAQRAVATGGVDRWVANLGQVATMRPDVLDKFDADVWADEYADMVGVNPQMVVPSERVALIRKQRAQAAQQQAQVEQAQMASQTARNLGAVQTPTGNAATDVMQLFSGY